MSDKRKLGPIRQMSLQSDSRSRPMLKKQLSVEYLDHIDEHKLSIRNNINSAKAKLSDRPRSVKVAWAENRQQSREGKDENISSPSSVKPSAYTESVEIKKCKEYKRPATAKIRHQNSVEKDSILYSRQELAVRLRKAWKEREDSKQNLNIFLTSPKNVDDNLDDENNYYSDIQSKVEKKEQLHLHLDLEEENVKNINLNSKPLLTNNNKIAKSNSRISEPESNYIPSKTNARPQDVRTNISVTIPSAQISQKPQQSSDQFCLENSQVMKVENNNEPKIQHHHRLVKQTSLIQTHDEEIPVVKTLPPRPQTAASKREGFQKRTNTAFTVSITSEKNFRPPLTRALSVPVKSEGSKLKFIATKRRLKPARRKGKEQESHSGDECGDEDEKGKKGMRCKSASNAEVVTMVSLVSPAGSDTEENLEQGKKQEDKEKAGSGNTGGNISTPREAVNMEPLKISLLRKSAKTVSFQQSSIHAVRSFSASFPSRRILMSSTSISSAFPEREKRAPVETSLGESRGPKRRLVRALSTTASPDDLGRVCQTQNSFAGESNKSSSSDLTNEKTDEIDEALGIIRAEVRPASAVNVSSKCLENHEKNAHSVEPNKPEPREQTENIEPQEEVDPDMPKFETNREKECWLMYKKMTDKGLPVSFDTILRGMLTPTEYRNVRKEIVSTS